MKTTWYPRVQTIAGFGMLLAFMTAAGLGQSGDGVSPQTLVPAASVSQTITFPDRAPFLSTGRTRGAVLHRERIAQVITVTTTNDTGDGSLRKAILDADANPGTDIITFNIPGLGVHTIAPVLKLPNITETVLIDATTQPGYIATPLIEIDGSNLGAYDVFDVFADACVIRGFAFNRVPAGSAIVIWSGNGNTIAGNLFGTDPSGSIPLGIAYNGVILFSADNVVGGTLASNRNIFAAIGNPAVAISGASARGNIVRGNYFGTDISGAQKLGTRQEAVFITNSASGNTVGGNVPGARNVISGSTTSSGISIANAGPGHNAVQGNFIGTDVNGINPMGNAGNGIFITRTDSVLIGGSGQGEGNVIGGNASPGVFVDTSARFASIVGNSIGVSGNGLSALPNSKGIVLNDSPGNRIEGNTISGNTVHGVEIRGPGAVGNTVRGNLIGTTGTGNDTLPNKATGVFVNGALFTVIGGSDQGAGNTISGNGTHGVSIIGATAIGSRVEGNFIGTDRTGTRKLGNGANGVYLDAAADTIGDIAPNIIAHNKESGVSISSGNAHRVVGNSIFDNGGLGIDLYPTGLTINDSLDGDAGANGLQNFPILDSARVTPANLIVHGHLDSQPNADFQIDFYSSTSANASHFGEGERYIGRQMVRTGANGTTGFVAAVSLPPDAHEFISATATDSQQNTSEFSQCLGLADTDGDGIPDYWETQGWGIDVNSDGVIDLDLYALGARPDHKDLFVEVDAMATRVPSQLALQKVAAAFAAAPPPLVTNPDGTPGIRLHTQLDDTNIGWATWTANEWKEFRDIEKVNFGTSLERASENARFILAAKRLVFRYCLFADNFSTSNYSGEAATGFEAGCNEFMVTLGTWTPPGGTIGQQAGTFMHELGHTLGLLHGGVDNIRYKPNYISVMNYAWQLPGDWSDSTILDYSRRALDLLDEAALDERVGLNPPARVFPILPVPYSTRGHAIKYAKLSPHTPVDWDGNGAIDTLRRAVDIDVFYDTSAVSPGEPLRSHEDWSGLIYSFRSSPGFYTGGTLPKVSALPPTEELDLKTYLWLKSLPPPAPSNLFKMDGRLDGASRILTSNHGMTIWAAYSNGELYVATASARARGATVHVFVSESPGALQPGPRSTTGQVAAWSAVLSNRKSDNSAGWFKASGDSVRISAAGLAVSDTLEGVIDLEYLLARAPKSIYIAVGVYQDVNGGSLIDQVPAGNGDGNIDAQEFAAVDAASPVLLTSFTATVEPGHGIRLQWTTAAEGPLLGFKIQRRSSAQTDDSTLAGSFTPAQGSPIESHVYSYLDSLAGGGDWWYRLLILDRDSVATFSPEISSRLVGVRQSADLPAAFALEQNYPNPFNPATVIGYDLPIAARVSLVIYDVLGREVATLLNDTQQPGRYRATWNPGGNVASGVYFYRIHAGAYVATRKMLLVR